MLKSIENSNYLITKTLIDCIAECLQINFTEQQHSRSLITVNRHMHVWNAAGAGSGRVR